MFFNVYYLGTKYCAIHMISNINEVNTGKACYSPIDLRNYADNFFGGLLLRGVYSF